MFRETEIDKYRKRDKEKIESDRGSQEETETG